MTSGLLLALLGCPGPEDSGAPTASTTDSDSAGTLPWLTQDDPTPAWTAEEAASRIEEAVAVGLPEPRLPLDTYLGLMAQGEGDCPGDETQLTDSVLYGCETSAGVYYEGVSEYVLEVSSGETAEYVAGDFLIRDADGVLLEVGGHAAHIAGDTPAGRWAEMEFHGSWVFTPSGTFLDPENSLALGASVDTEGVLGVHGGWGRGDGDLYFEVMTWTWEGQGHPVGDISIREPAGFWYTLSLGGDDGCGEVVWGTGEALGRACVELRSAGEALAAKLVADR